MTSLYIFIVLFTSIFYQLINSQSTTIVPSTTSILNNITTTIEANESTTMTVSESIISINTTFLIESNTSAIDDNSRTKSPSKLRRWLFISPIVTIVVVIGIGIIHYYRRQSPYRRCIQWWELCKIRFLENWRSRDDDNDNIILQLEQPEMVNDQWPPQISFA